MTASLRASHLCQGCQLDLLSLFERGFCSTATSTATRALRRPIRPALQARQFSTSNRRRQEDQELSFGGRAPSHEKVRVTDTAQGQLDALKQPQDPLGRPIEKAIEEDQNTDQGDSDEWEGGFEQSEVLGNEDAITRLRRGGTGTEEIAQRARKVFGERLPEGILQDQELKVYKRFYGEPLPELEDVSADVRESTGGDESQKVLLDQEGGPIDYDMEFKKQGHDLERRISAGPSDALLDERTRNAVESLDGEMIDDQLQDEFYDGEPSDRERSHPLTALGKFGTQPRTVTLPSEDFTGTLTALMSNYSNKHLREVCELTFGGPGLPDSPLTPRSGKGRQQVAVQLEASQQAMSQMEANAFLTAVMPPAYAAITSVLAETRKRLGSTWLTALISKKNGPRVLDAGAGGAGILAWNEVVRAHWESLHTSDKHTPPPPPASKAVVLTSADTLRHRAAAMLENTSFVPRLPNYIDVRGFPTLEDDRPVQHRKDFDVVISTYSLLPFKEDWEKKQYVQNLWTMLSSKGGVLVLIEKGIPRGFEAIAGARDMLLERYIAVPPGQTTHYTARHRGEGGVHQPTTGMIIAPCTNHERCPMYKVPGVMVGRKDFCAFQQRYTRPPHLQRVLGATSRNHDDVDFSYISVMKGQDLRRHRFTVYQHIEDPALTTSGSSQEAQNMSTTTTGNTEDWLDELKAGFSHVDRDSTLKTVAQTENAPAALPATHLMPRLVYPPIKRHGHIILDMCTPIGTIERWTVPRSFSKKAYRDARKAQWGDLWALGAKTRIPRSLNLGSPKLDTEAKSGKGRTTTQEQRDRINEQLQQEEEEARQEELMEERLMQHQLGREEALEEHDGDDELDEKLNAFEEVAMREWESQFAPQRGNAPRSVRVQKAESRLRPRRRSGRLR